MRSFAAGAVVGMVCLWASGDARAQTCCSGVGTTCHLAAGWPTCSSSTGCVTLDATVAATGSPPAADTGFNPGGFTNAHSFAVTGKKLVGINNSNGSILFSTTVNNVTLDNFPEPIILTADCTGTGCSTSTKITNFIAGDDGNLYKVVFDTSTSLVTTSLVNLQRPGCTLDKLKGTPAVQLNRFSNSTFQTAMGNTTTDLVIVGTYYPDQGGSCPGGQNRVYALRSDNLAVKWVFNLNGSEVVDPVTEACYLEYYSGTTPAGTNNNMAVCGFNKSGTTPGLIAFNTATTLPTGSVRWSADTVGGVVIRPAIATLNNRRAVYVGTTDGYLRAYSPADGSFFWTGGIPLVQNGIAQNIWAEFRGGPLSNRIFVVASDGTFRRFVDNGTTGTEEGIGLTADTTGAVKYVSMAVPAPSSGINAIYLGRNDGKVQQISSSYVQQETQIVGGPNANVFDPSLDIAPDGTVTQLVVTAGASGVTTPGKIARLNLPWCANSNGAGGAACNADQSCEGYATHPNQYDPCSIRACDGAQCAAPVAAPDNTPCDDGSNCSFSFSSSGGCPSNKCVGGSNNGAACSSDSQCPGGTCFMNRCVGGPTPNAQCNTNGDCTGAGTNGNCVKGTLGTIAVTTCDSGSEAGNHCKLVCVGGDFAGLPCLVDADCAGTTSGVCSNITASPECPPAGRCVRWSAATDGSCTAIQSNPFCNTSADCPRTRYCALDPKNLRGGFSVCENNATGAPAPTSTDDCCVGGVGYGPCLVWDTCDTVNHVCKRTNQGQTTPTACGLLLYGESGCAGGPTGAGGVVGKTCTGDATCQGGKCVSGRCTSECNNVCQAGRCVSTSYANCLCESYGDRACGTGTTCCGFQGTCKRFGDTCAANGDCCSGNCRSLVCDEPALTCKRFGSACSASSECCSQNCSGGFCTAVNPGDNCFNLDNDQHHCGACDNDCGLYACVNGVCQAPGSSACTDAPSIVQILSAGATGANSIAFEHTNLNAAPSSQRCGAWLAASPSAISGQMIRVGGSGTQTFSTPTSMLVGISPACQGDAPTIFACGSNPAEIVLATFPTLTSTPIARYNAGTIFSDTPGTPASATSGPALFHVSNYNSGPVGPAFDWKDYDGTTTNRIAYWGNWNTNGDVKKIAGSSWTVTNAPVSPNPLPERVSAIAFGRRDYLWSSTTNGSHRKQKANSLYIGHGTKLTIVNIDTPPAGFAVNSSDPLQIDIDLLAACEATSCSLRCDGGSHNGAICTSPSDANCTGNGGTCTTQTFCFGPHGGGACTTTADCHGCGPEAPTGIQSIAPHPETDAVFLVVKGTSDTFIVEVRPRARTARKASDAQDELSQADPAVCPNSNNDNQMSCAGCAMYQCIPSTVNLMDAKLAFDAFGNLVWIGLGNTVGSGLQSVQSYTATNK